MKLSELQVLIVEDMDAIRGIISEQLRLMGFSKVFTAENANRGLEVIYSHQIDLILLDWIMPGSDGSVLLEAIRKSQQWNNIPVIIITANTNKGMIQGALKYGVADIVVKPFTAKTLQARILKCLNQGRSSFFDILVPTEPVTNALNLRENVKIEKNTLLVVDDMPDNLVLIANLLKDVYKIKIAKNGKTALRICNSSSPPDLVLLDIMMPDMDGYQVLKALRDNPNTEKIPVIFVTALSEIEAQLDGLKSGAIDFIVKPIQPEILKLRVANLMALVNMQRNIQADYDNMLDLAKLRDGVDEIINHELKTPLTAINSIVERLFQDKSHSKDLLNKIHLIHELTDKTIETINISSAIFKIETGRYEHSPEVYSVHEQIKHILNTLHLSFRFKQLIAYQTPDEDPNHEFDVNADPALCYSLLMNLIKNAYEAAKARSKVAIYYRKEGSKVIISIENDGVVDEAIRDNFWEKYITNKKQNGTGLGTYTARLLAQAQGGDTELFVDDENNTTRIEVTFPAGNC